MLRWFSGILLAIISSAALAAVKGEEVSYEAEGVVMKGYLAYDDAIQGKRPGVLVVHEWWGHNDYARKRARMLAEMGYTALAVDMYGSGKTADHPDNAKQFMSEVMGNLPLMKQRFRAAEKALKKHKTVDDKRLGAIGYCFGGAVVLNMARQGEKLAGVVSFHGSLGTSDPARYGKVKAQVLVLNGAEDPFITAEQIEGLQEGDGQRRRQVPLHQLSRRPAQLHQPGRGHPWQEVQHAVRLQQGSRPEVLGGDAGVLQRPVPQEIMYFAGQGPFLAPACQFRAFVPAAAPAAGRT